ncbi:SDR family NAD(P)-dependent oxidoreductase [Azohydromonas caseinilytica]|uniref:SDR family oxidoreductase n=1 Tax=Azohydromonas caseinilytica TaxID=2728836 RepID=A0A848FD71_9BURK|nr:SDR family NAD(P)-dependent oxidoreductase [Azohydromonas caseinilytica]NML16745.1 SDR family oxidoreductase [Azohydromonas caseinilytica]
MAATSEAARSQRVVVVTGAGQGLGRAYALRFATQGHRVVAIDLRADALATLAEAIRAEGGECLPLALDVGDADAVANAARDIDARFGRADVLVNNAAIFSTLKMRPFDEIPLDEWGRVLHVNVTGTFLMVRAIAPLMRRNGWGRIVNVSSAAVLMGRPHYLHYTTSKAAVIGMTRSLARELGADGITVNAVLPGAVDTEIPRETVTPAQKQAQIAMRCIQRTQTTDDVTGAVLFLASEDSRFISGQSLVIDGGLTFL